MAWHNPFDLYYWFVNVFAGSMPIFLAIAFLFVASMSALFRMPTIITGIFFSLFIILLSAVTGNLYVLVILVIALVIGWSIARLFR